jgi:Xaa-Pro aminopeptidase
MDYANREERSVMTVKRRVQALRDLMKEHRIAAYFVPTADAHQNEYVPECWKRREWLSGFTGSAGDVVVTMKEACLWTDARYFLQAAEELKGSGIRLQRHGEPGVPKIQDYLAAQLSKGDALGVDPRVVSHALSKAFTAALKSVGVVVKPIEENLVDRLWTGQPGPSRQPIQIHPKRFAGETVASKLRRLRKKMKDKKADAHVLTSLDSIAWLFNIRGQDVEFNPVVISYALVTAKEATLFINPEKVPPAARKRLGTGVTIRPYQEIVKALRALGKRNARVWVDGATASRWIVDLLDGADLIEERSSVVLMKAKKNAAEIAGMRQAQVQDGIAMVRFLRWLDETVATGEVTEMYAADCLEQLRCEGETYQGLSFRTISGYGPHGAIIHYSATPKTDLLLRTGGIYLIDSGGQYLDGTTDITRTVLLGRRATKQQKERFTRVLKGHIALATLAFPSGVSGIRIDVLARLPLWNVGLDYKHGTGHGVGAYLNVHEGPQSITPYRDTGAALEPGNILSNEPGFYEDGAYGMRTENLILVEEDPKLSKNGGKFLRFETLTLCPIDTRLVDVRLLDPAERKWLNDYHKRVNRTLGPHLGRADRAWLRKACAPV